MGTVKTLADINDSNLEEFQDRKLEGSHLSVGEAYRLSKAIQNTPGLCEKDPINPKHYKSNKIETIEVIRNSMTQIEFEGYLSGNVVKYISRYRNKNGVEDLKKAEWYLQKLISVNEKE